MAESPIEWTDATWNPIGGCSIKSAGCAPCYAQRLAGTRLRHHPLYAGTTTPNKDGKPVFNGTLTAATDDAVWDWPLRWRGAKSPKLGDDQPSLIFVGDMSDLFHEGRPAEHIDRAFGVMGRCEDAGRSHIFQLLTKRTDVMRHYVQTRAYHSWNATRLSTEAWPARNVWLGFSAERQQEFDERWAHMRPLAVAGWTIFVSYEPALAPLVLPDDFLAIGRRAQVIAGGMSGTDAMAHPTHHPAWFRSVRDQCYRADVGFFFKQWGEWAPAGQVKSEALSPVHEYFGDVPALNQKPIYMTRAGKKAAGRLLDGVEHNGFPEVRP